MSVSINGAGSITGIDQGFNVTTGSVGIGTDNPVAKVHISGTGANDIRIDSDATALSFHNHSEFIGFIGNDSGKLFINAGGTQDTLLLQTGGSERLRIASNGGVGIGTNNPNGLLALTAASGRLLTLRNSTTGSGSGDGSYLALSGSDLQIANAESANLILYTADTERFRITSAGVLQAAAGVNLQMASNGRIFVGNGGNATDPMFANVSDTNTGIAFPAADTMMFTTGGSERLRITSGGQVNIGSDFTQTGFTASITRTSSETDILRIKGNGGNAFVRFEDNDASSSFTLGADDAVGSGGFALYDRSDSAYRVVVDTAGRVSINATSPAQVGGQTPYLYVSSYTNLDGLRIRGLDTGNTIWKTGGDMSLTVSSNNAINLKTQSATRLSVTGNGQVTMPNQPCFWATSNTGGSDTSEGYSGIFSNQLEAAYVNVGNHFNTSTGVFTCPVAGTYEFHGQGLIRYQTGVGRAELSFYKNGVNTMSRAYGYTYITGVNDHDNLHIMAYITCAANDQIDLRVYAMDSGIDCYFAQGLGYFAGRLVQ